MKKPWPFNRKYIRIHIKNPNKDQRFLNQVPTLGLRQASVGMVYSSGM